MSTNMEPKSRSQNLPNDWRCMQKQQLVEAKMMNFILASSDRDLILGELGFNSDSFVRSGVTRPIISDPSNKPGDIDVLICDKDRPDQAVALQCKRIKVRENQRVNKLGN